MDPLILLALGVLVLFIVLKVFFGMAKTLFKFGLLIVIVVIVWRYLAGT